MDDKESERDAIEETKGLIPSGVTPVDRDRDARKDARCDDASAARCDIIRDACCDVAVDASIEHLCDAMRETVLSSYSDEVATPIRKGLKSQLERHRETIGRMDREAMLRLTSYLASRFVQPCTRVGTIAAQSVMHGATQGQLSAFHRAGDSSRERNNYPSLTDMLELRCKGCVCTFSPQGSIRKAMRHLALVYLSEIVESRRRSEVHKPYWSSVDVDDLRARSASLGLVIIALDKAKMAQYGILASDVRSSLGKYISQGRAPDGGQNSIIIADVSPNVCASIYVYYTHHELIHAFGRSMEGMEVSPGGTIRGLRRVETDHGVHLECPSANLRHVIAYGDLDVSTLFCNDAREVYSILGISACFRLIYETITRQTDVSEEDALLVAGYMTWSGCPRPFVKQSVKDEYGPMFDMYYERPRHTLMEWAEREREDTLNNPYTRIMVGTQNTDFSLLPYKTKQFGKGNSDAI